MFYSHEILTSHQYGVATVWLVATVGVKSNTKKLSKKVIQEVNVHKACKTIGEPPGAPIALRLQGNLLYGVSRVYSQQYTYLLTDAEKVQSHMRTFYRALPNNATDPEAGKTKRGQLILLDDPDFVPDMQLPEFKFDADDGTFVFSKSSQLSGKTSSQLSPLDVSRSPADASFINLQIRHSSSLSSLHLASPFGGDGIAEHKPGDDLMPIIFGEEEELPFGDFGLAIDADGNVIEEPELPPHRPSQQRVDDGLILPGSGDHLQQQQAEGAPLDFDGDAQMIFGEDPLPDAEALPSRKRKETEFEEDMSSESAAAPSRRARRAKVVKLDHGDSRISRMDLKSWNTDYLSNMELARNSHRQIGPAQARKNAYNLTFGLGIANIGQMTAGVGLVHPLAELFSGRELQARIVGLRPADDEGESPRGRRRSADEAFEEDEEERDRRVRLRLDEDGEQQGRGVQDAQMDDMALMFDNDLEVGREPGSALSEMLSSVPWNRPLSVVPSSAQSQKSAQARAQAGHHMEGSPLVGRGSILPDIERFSDNGPAFGSDGFGPLPDQGSSFSEFGPAAGISTQEAQTSQFMRQALDREGRNFLGFVQRVATESGEDRLELDHPDRRWVQFDDLIQAPDNTKAVAAQAFYHVLSLAIKGIIEVEQEGIENMEPFGTIHLGLATETEEAQDGNEGDIATT